MVQRIAAVVTQCIDCFGKIFRAPTTLAPNSPTFGRDMADQQTRFNVWAGNIGAHRTGLSSLDYRLRDSSQIEDQVLSLLKDLIELMQDAHDILMGNEVPWDKINAGDDEDFDGRDTEFNQISVDIADVVNCLLRLSVAIRNPAPHDRFIKSHSIDKSHYETFDIQHVSSKFRTIEPLLAERLRKAISRRRQFFNYRLAHRTKLSQGLTHEGGDAETIASSLPEYLKDVARGGQPLPINAIGDEGSDSGCSQTSYATSLADLDQCRIPPLPKDSSEESDDKDERVSESDSSAESIDIISNQDEQGTNNIQPEEPPTSYSMLRTDEMTALPPNDPNASMTNRQNEYFVQRDGIDREVITADICQYLGQDALVRPGHYEELDFRIAYCMDYGIKNHEIDPPTAMLEKAIIR
ncbi:hypothetical protein FOXYS1_6640 [Fusarium oxysporum]|uniref:Prion-inhibition and propagation HeLo domain-containing protein n=1 Tax=Fusarium oxysporum TaxID=5507 RepID=A0A8H5AEL4_FUSOX|nr:hypothetical protein FOXYS1_6640 [Fusarium oxysporum]